MKMFKNISTAIEAFKYFSDKKNSRKIDILISALSRYEDIKQECDRQILEIEQNEIKSNLRDKLPKILDEILKEEIIKKVLNTTSGIAANLESMWKQTSCYINSMEEFDWHYFENLTKEITKIKEQIKVLEGMTHDMWVEQRSK